MAESSASEVTAKLPAESAGVLAESMQAMKLKQIEDDLASTFVLVDIGANLTNSKYSRDLDSVVERAKDAGKFAAFVSLKSYLFFGIKSPSVRPENFSLWFLTS